MPDATPATPTCETAHELRAWLMDRVNAGAITLPLLPEAVQQVLALITSDDWEPRQLSDAIRRDLALSTHLLRYANSAMYSPGVPVVSLQQAVTRLGLTKIRRIAISIACQESVFTGRARVSEMRALFRHSLATAAYGQEIARHRRRNVEEAYLGGLLHAVGKPVILQALSQRESSGGESFEATVVETVLDECHAAVGLALLERWSMPARFLEIVQYQHDPGAAPTVADTAMTVGVAGALAHRAVGPRAVTDTEIREHALMEPLNLYPEDVEALLGKARSIASLVDEMA